MCDYGFASVSYIFAHSELHAVHENRRSQYIDYEPKRYPWFRQRATKNPFTVFTGVNTLFNALLNNPDFKNVDFSHLKVTLGGGMAVQKAVAERWKQATRSTLVQAYGLTETSPAVCVNPLTEDKFNGSIGLPIPSTLVSIRDEDGNVVPEGEAGELCIKGPQVMRGYWQREDETKKSITEDGWFHSGDIATMDKEGYVTIVDRKKDMI